MSEKPNEVSSADSNSEEKETDDVEKDSVDVILL
jgi:hypothetical protein